MDFSPRRMRRSVPQTVLAPTLVSTPGAWYRGGQFGELGRLAGAAIGEATHVWSCRRSASGARGEVPSPIGPLGVWTWEGQPRC